MPLPGADADYDFTIEVTKPPMTTSTGVLSMVARDYENPEPSSMPTPTTLSSTGL